MTESPTANALESEIAVTLFKLSQPVVCAATAQFLPLNFSMKAPPCPSACDWIHFLVLPYGPKLRSRAVLRLPAIRLTTPVSQPRPAAVGYRKVSIRNHG
jgi:hypothetical protein